MRGEAVLESFCSACHEPDGAGNGDERIPRIAGWDFPSVKRTLVLLGADYSEVHEPGMSDLVSMLTEAEIDAIADYISQLTLTTPAR